MMKLTIQKSINWLLLSIFTLCISATFTEQAYSQRPPRQIRTYVPPDQLVSFRPEMQFDQFLEFINPIFERVTGKTVIDPEARQEPIGITITSMQFFDALEFVLEVKA